MDKKTIKFLAAAAAACLCVKYSDAVLRMISLLLGTLEPLILGAMLAYVLNIFMKRLERIYFPKRTDGWAIRTRRPVCVFASVLSVLILIIAVLFLVIPALGQSLNVLTKDMPAAFSRFQRWTVQLLEDIPEIQKEVSALEIDWPDLYKKSADFLSKGITGIFNSAFSAVNVIANSTITGLMALIFSIYLLFQKETLKRQARKVMRAYFPEKLRISAEKFFALAHETFTNFITGQITEAVIIGTLCALGLAVLQIPYAAMTGVLVGVTALIPVVGAYLGAVLGAFMIVTVSPLKALIFLIFLAILQQVEGNLIYPKVVGQSIGLPGIWVLASVTVGGGLFGIFGMLIGVPLAATGYKWMRGAVEHRLAVHSVTSNALRDAHKI